MQALVRQEHEGLIMGVRKVVTRRGKRVRGYFPSLKTKFAIAWESTLERDALALLELSSAVVRIESQPIEIRYWDSHTGKERSYFPDFRVELTYGQEMFIEVKPARVLNRPDEKARFESIAAEFDSLTRPFRIVTDATIRMQPRLRSMRTLVPFHGTRMTEYERNRWIDKLMNSEVRTLGDWTQMLADRPLVYRLIAQGLLLPDWNYPLNANMPLSLNEETSDVLYV